LLAEDTELKKLLCSPNEENKGEHFITMEYVPGKTLDDRYQSASGHPLESQGSMEGRGGGAGLDLGIPLPNERCFSMPNSFNSSGGTPYRPAC
jgi:hypothetical protein